MRPVLERVAAGPPNKKLSLLAWTWTTQGWAMYERYGKEKFYEWAVQQTEELIKFKTLKMGEFLKEVSHRLGHTKKREHLPKGDLLRTVHDAKDEFLMAACFKWTQIPPALRHKQQRRFRDDSATFYRLQHDFINSGEDIIPIAK